MQARNDNKKKVVYKNDTNIDFKILEKVKILDT